MIATADRPRIVVVGGGLAGLAAASVLAGPDVDLTLLESRPRLGGRACSFTDPVTGALVDNCQHVSMGCCSNLADFCERIGIAEAFRREPTLVFLDPEGRRSVMQASRLPAPLHLAGSILRARYLTLAERIRVAIGVLSLRYAPAGSTESLESWLRRHGQTTRTLQRFWETVLISALNERLDQTDIGYARKVFYEGLLGNRAGYELLIPTQPLGELYGAPVQRWLEEHGATVRLGTGIRSLATAAGRITGVVLRTGQVVPADQVVLAVPWDRVGAIVPEELHEMLPAIPQAGAIQAAPITGIHLWFDRPVCPVDHAALVGRTTHWVFNHTALQGRASPEGRGQYLQLVISAAFDLVPLGREAIRDRALADLEAVWPGVAQARLERWWVVTEHTATISVRPGIDRLRPPQATMIPGLTLAGDWTKTGWPSTMEGAVRSGYLAAEAVRTAMGRPARWLVPDLPNSWLARVVLGCP